MRLFAALVLVVALGAESGARAQDAEVTPLSTGFTPDPLVFRARTSSSRPLRQIAPGCTGHVGSAPSHTLEVDGEIPFLRLFALAPQEVTIAIRGPDGRWRCSGRREGASPREEGAFAPGRHEIWVGSAQPNRQIPYELHVTEFRSVTETSAREGEPGTVGTADIGLTVDAEEGRFRGRRLRRGFLPDPREDGGRALGSIDVRLLGAGCAGFVDAVPSHVLSLRNDFDYFRVQLGDAAGTATIILRTPGGRYLCSSPTEANAFVDQEAWPEGDYRIWIGARSTGTEVDYRICYTEVRPAEGTVACGSGRMGSGAVRAAGDGEPSDD